MGVCSSLRVGLVCLCLGGCSVAGVTGGGTAPATYQISAPETRDLHLTRWQVNLSVQMPAAPRSVDTDRIMITKAGQISYFAGVAWSDRLPLMLRSSITAALQDSGAFRTVLNTEDRAGSDYAIAADVRHFQIEMRESNTALATVTLIARISNAKTGKVIATKEFAAHMPASGDDPDTGVAALQKAFGQVTVEMVRWTSSQRGRTVALN